jgi:hypothetical protein
MKFNTASQAFHVIAFDENGRVTGDAANITCELAIDGGDRDPLGDTNPTEIGTTGEYVFSLTQAETNGHALSFTPVSSSGAQVIGVPSNIVYTTLESDIKAKTDLISTATVNVIQTSSSGATSYDVTTYIAETHAITLLTSVDHTGKTLEVIFEPTSRTDSAVILSDHITIASDSISFNRPNLGTFPGKYIYAVRDTGNGNEVLIRGNWNYARAAKKDS